MHRYLVYALPEHRAGRTTRPIVAIRYRSQADFDSASCEAISPRWVNADGAAAARAAYKALEPAAGVRSVGGI